MSEVEQLVKMANQIAENFSFHEDSVARTVDHLQRFWAPSMRNLLIAFEQEGGEGLKPIVVTAIRQMAEG
jgi:formate dehydrogenase subunit delta